MAAQIGGNEGIRVLEDFICVATAAEAAQGATHANGANLGMRVISETIGRASHLPLTADRIEEFQRLPTCELLAFVQLKGDELTPDELSCIHDIAIDRFAKDDDALSKGSDKLSREVMHVAARRIA
jgi:hypothetical protein